MIAPTRPTRRDRRPGPIKSVLSGLVGAGCLAASLLAGAAPADHAARFAYSRGEGAADCPEADAIRDGVAARLGYEPFDDAAAAVVVTSVARVGATLEARIEMRDAAGDTKAERLLTSRQRDCAELASAIELAISIAVDPAGAARPRPETPPSPPPSPPAPSPIIIVRPAPAAPVPVTAPVSAPPPVPLILQVRLGALGAIGSAPAVAYGATLAASIRRRALSIAVEGRADFSASMALRTGEVGTSLLTGSLVPCVHRGLIAGCALLTGGGVRASGAGLLDSRQLTIPFLALGGRLALELPLGGLLVGHVSADVSAPLTQTVLRVSGEAVWTSPPIAAMFGLGVGARFP